MDTTAALSLTELFALPVAPGHWLYWLGAVLGGYLFGSIPFGLVLARLGGYGDIRKIGSGNIGATNVLRTGNKPLALATLLLDAGKGAIAVWLVLWLMPVPVIDHNGPSLAGPDIIFLPELVFSTAAIAGLGAIIGHCYPIWLGFKGGKGVATAMGMLLIAPWWPVGIATGLTWLVSAALFRISSLSALISIAAAPLYALLLGEIFLMPVTIALGLLIFWRHRENIARLRRGEEPKIGGKKKNETEAPAESTE